MSSAVVEDRIFQALADPSRRAIFVALTHGEAAVKDLTARFDISQPAVSQHLATLRDAGLVQGRRDGRLVYYRVEPRGMKPLIDWMAHYRAFWTEHMGRLERLLSDAEWWVRYRAAKALVRLLGVDPSELECIRLRLHDRYAKDILEQAVAESRVR